MIPEQPQDQSEKQTQQQTHQQKNHGYRGKGKNKGNKSKDPLVEAKSFFSKTYEHLLMIEVYEEADEPLSMDIMNDIMDDLDTFVKKKGREISMSQLRRIFPLIDKVNDISEGYLLVLARPKLAYISARQKNQGAKPIVALIDDLVKHTTTNRHLQSLKAIMEGIISYHKLYH